MVDVHLMERKKMPHISGSGDCGGEASHRCPRLK
jgi:hypothetical protein